MEWIFDGIGTEIIGIVISLIIGALGGGAVGYKIGIKRTAKQKQMAGDDSQLMQAGTINIYNGIDEKRAREICAETYAVVRKDFTADAYACANARVEQFENALMPRMLEIEGALSAFSDPAFQFLLASAQRTAAATERDSDYDMLSELLMCRITKGTARKSRAGISRAVEIIDKIDDDALCALTVVHAINKVRSSFCIYERMG